MHGGHKNRSKRLRSNAWERIDTGLGCFGILVRFRNIFVAKNVLRVAAHVGRLGNSDSEEARPNKFNERAVVTDRRLLTRELFPTETEI
jgi:hypothetical protein